MTVFCHMILTIPRITLGTSYVTIKTFAENKS